MREADRGEPFFFLVEAVLKIQIQIKLVLFRREEVCGMSKRSGKHTKEMGEGGVMGQKEVRPEGGHSERTLNLLITEAPGTLSFHFKT